MLRYIYYIQVLLIICQICTSDDSSEEKSQIKTQQSVGNYAYLTCYRNCSESDTDRIYYYKDDDKVAVLDTRTNKYLLYNTLKQREVNFSQISLLIKSVRLVDNGKWTCSVICKGKQTKSTVVTTLIVSESPTITISIGNSRPKRLSLRSDGMNYYAIPASDIGERFTNVTFTVNSNPGVDMETKQLAGDESDYVVYDGQCESLAKYRYLCNHTFAIRGKGSEVVVYMQIYYSDADNNNYFYNVEISVLEHSLGGLKLFAHIFILLVWIFSLIVVAFIIFKMFQNSKNSLSSDDAPARCEWRYAMFGIIMVLLIPLLGLLLFVYLTKRWKMLEFPNAPGVLLSNSSQVTNLPEKEKLKPEDSNKQKPEDSHNNSSSTERKQPHRDAQADDRGSGDEEEEDESTILVNTPNGTETEV